MGHSRISTEKLEHLFNKRSEGDVEEEQADEWGQHQGVQEEQAGELGQQQDVKEEQD